MSNLRRILPLLLCLGLLLAGLGCSLRRCFRCTACAAASTHAVAAAHASASASHVNPPLAVNFSVKGNMKSGGKTLRITFSWVSPWWFSSCWRASPYPD